MCEGESEALAVSFSRHDRANRANSSMPTPRGDKWEQAGPNQMFRQGYQFCSIDRYQPGVRRTSPPYLITLLHPKPLSLRTGMSSEDIRIAGRRKKGEKEKTWQET